MPNPEQAPTKKHTGYTHTRHGLEEMALTAPHNCADPECVGGINQRKLELFDEMVTALDGIAYARVVDDGAPDGEEVLAMRRIARAILTKVKAVMK